MNFIASVLQSIVIGVGLTWLYRILKLGYLKYGRACIATFVDERGEQYNKVISKLSVLDDEFEQRNESLIRYIGQTDIVGEEFFEDERVVNYVDFLRKLKSDHYHGIKFLGSIIDETPPAFEPLRKRIERDNKRYKLALKKYRHQVFNLMHDCGRYEYLSKHEWSSLCTASELAFEHGKPPVSAFFDFCLGVGAIGQIDSFRTYLDNGHHGYTTVWAYK